MTLRWSVLVALAACHPGTGGGGSPDAFTGPATLTVQVNAQGMATSSPAGIQCGQCSIPATLGGCPDPQVGTVCSAEFDAGTSIKLSLGDQEIYFATSCSSPALATNSCTFEIASPMTVTVTGVEAVR